MAFARALCDVLVGREDELSALEDALLSSVRGEGGVVLLGGEAGMGKSRLASELMRRAERIGCTVMFGGCSEADLSLPYLPFLQAIGNRLGQVDVAALASRLGASAGELAQLFPQFGRSEGAHGDPTQAKLRLFEAVVALLRDSAGERALLLVLEDVHWADPSTRELLDYLTRRLRSTNVLVLGTYRSDELHRKHPLQPTIQGWRRARQVEVLELEPLQPDQVALMISVIFDDTEVTPDFRDFIHQRTEGNPFVIEEMLKAALDRGDIFRARNDWERKPLSEFRLPSTVRDMILLRLERLGPELTDTLAAASVIGRAFDIDTLAALTRQDAQLVAGTLHICVLNQLLEESSVPNGFQFRHALTREAIYEDMVAPRRQQIHSRLADLLAEQPGVPPLERANHLLAAGRYGEAVPLCIAAAEEAARAYAYSESALLYERALAHAQDRRRRAELLCLVGDAHWKNEDSGRAKRNLEEGIHDLEELGLELEAASWRLTLGRCLWELKDSRAAAAEYERARQVLEAGGPSEALAIAYLRLGGLAAFDGRNLEGLELSRHAHEVAREAKAEVPFAWSLNFMGISEIALGMVEEGFEHLDESYRLSRDGKHQQQLVNATYNISWIALNIGRGRHARSQLQRVAREVPAATSVGWYRYCDALATLHSGSIEQATEMLEKTMLSYSVGRQHPTMQWRCSVALAQALAEADRGVEAREVLPALDTRADAQDAMYDGAARVRTAFALRDEAGAKEAARTVPASSCDLGSPAEALSEAAGRDQSFLADLLARIPDGPRAANYPNYAAAAGRLALAEGRVDEATTGLGSAYSRFVAEEMELDSWHVGRDLAEAQSRAGDNEAATRLLQQIVNSATKGGAHLAARLALETAQRLGLEVAMSPLATAAGDAQAAAEPWIPVGERLVTVLFADVRGYTAMTQRATPSEMVDKVASLQRWAAQEVARARGHVDKFAGDAVMATFNVSGTSVDHAHDALRAAIAIRDKASLLDLAVGVGIASGPAVVGNLTVGANMSVVGETTNLASRLQGAAGASEIVLSEEAHRRVHALLKFKGMQAEQVELHLKGFDKPVTAYRVPAPARAAK